MEKVVDKSNHCTLFVQNEALPHMHAYFNVWFFIQDRVIFLCIFKIIDDMCMCN